MNVNEIKSYYQDNGKWKECEFLSGEEMAQRATELLRENERLNNIINELEKEIYNVVDKMNNSLIEIEGRGYYYQDLLPLECLIYKLKELKEGNND